MANTHMIGIAGTIALPLHGAYLSMRRKVAGTPQRLMREPRAALAHLEAATLSQSDKNKILSGFEEVQKKTEERKGYYKRKAEIFLMNMKKEEEASAAESGAKGEHGKGGAGRGYVLTEGNEVGYIQEGELRKLSEEDIEKMSLEERQGYEQAKKELQGSE